MGRGIKRASFTRAHTNLASLGILQLIKAFVFIWLVACKYNANADSLGSEKLIEDGKKT